MVDAIIWHKAFAYQVQGFVNLRHRQPETNFTIMPQTEFILKAEDCVAGMGALPAESVDIVVTSPPYIWASNTGITMTIENGLIIWLGH